MDIRNLNKFTSDPNELQISAGSGNAGRTEKPGQVQQTSQADKAAQAERAAREESLRSQVEGDLRSVSEDGDELRVSAAGAELETARNEIGTVVTSDDDGVVTRLDDEEDMITDLTGYTMSQIETFYYQGRVSRYDYEQELQDQEQLDEELGLGVDAVLAEEKTADAADSGKNAASVAADNMADINTSPAEIKAVSEPAVNTAGNTAAERTDNAAENAKRTEAAAENNRAAAEELGRVAAEQVNEQIQTDALESAAENGRSDIMAAIFNIGT